MMTPVADAEILFRTYHHRVFRYLYRTAGEVDTAHDLTQDVFLRVSRVAVPEVPEGQQAAWLFQIARNILLDHLRRLGRRPRETSAETHLLTGRPASQETSAAVNQALAALTDTDRDVFLLREVAGLGYEEIGAICRLSPDAVRNRIHRARLALRERLEAPIAARRIEPMGRRRDEP
jgi:RNA polymerase sigma-70 factor (ECF subfamily)